MCTYCIYSIYHTTTTKSLQLCPTLCDPTDGSPPGSPFPGILQARSGLPFPSPLYIIKTERPLPPPVSLASHGGSEKPPEVTCTSRGNPGFPASTRERPRETFFNTSRGQIPLPWLGSNDALPIATRMETRLPRRPTRGSLTSASYLVRNRTLRPPLENNPEIAPSSRDEGLRLLHGLATNLATSLQTPQEA